MPDNNSRFRALLPKCFQNAELIETHISSVFLSDELVLKFKKAVQFDFIDMSTLEKRWAACQKEVMLNRRLAPDTYLGVLPLSEAHSNSLDNLICCNSEHGHKIPPNTVEAAVLMKRLPEEQQLLNRLSSRDCRDEITALGELLAQFHREHRIPAAELDIPKFTEDMLQRILDNFSALAVGVDSKLSSAASHALSIAESYTKGIIANNLKEMLTSRCSDGWIVDGHGDLRAEHVYILENKISAIDCLEFNKELRTIDVLNDIGFLCMDLERLRRADLASLLLKSYAKQLDLRAKSLLTFYKSYRAMVRAKVAYLKESQMDEPHNFACVEEYLSRASCYALGLNRPLIIAIGGLMGSGKSTLANHLGTILGAKVISTDEVRQKLFRKASNDKRLGFGEGKYSEKGKNATYDLLFSIADRFVKQENSIILDASFMNEKQRREAKGLAESHNCEFLFIHCIASKEILVKRLVKRSSEGLSSSDGRKELLDKQMTEFDPLTETSNYSILEVSTEQNTIAQAEEILGQLPSTTNSSKDAFNAVRL
jgi:hypothetical protein